MGAASNGELGALVSEHKATAAGLLRVVLLMLGSLAVASLLLGTGIFGADSSIGGRVMISLLGLFFLLPFGFGAYGLVRGRGAVIRIHEDGIAIHRSGVDTLLLWDDIVSYNDGAFLTVGTKDEQFDFGMAGLSGGAELLSKMRDEVTTKRAVPRMMATLREGKTGLFEGDGEGEGEADAPTLDGVVDVAGFMVDTSGIITMDSEEEVPWTAVTDIRSEEKTLASGKLPLVTTYVVVSTATRKFRVTMNSRSNRDAMLGLCGEMMRG